MENTQSSWGWLIILLIFIVVLGAIFGDGFFGAKGGRAYDNGCSVVSNCQVEKQTIINTATTQNLINEQAEKTRDQAARIFEAQNAEKLFDAKMRIQALEAEKVATAHYNALAMQNKDCCCELNRRLDTIECEMLKKPRIFGVAATCTGQVIPPLTA